MNRQIKIIYFIGFLLTTIIIPFSVFAQDVLQETEVDFSPIKEHKARYYNRAQKLLKLANETSSPNRFYDVTYYKLHLNINFDPDEIMGSVTIQGKSQSDSLSTIELDFHDNLQITGTSSNVESYSHNNFALNVKLTKSIPKDSLFSIEIMYRGHPSDGGNAYFVFDTTPDGSRSVWTLSESYGAKYWWPCKDSPQDKADSVDIFITVPDGQKAVSNGTLKSVVLNETPTATWHWQVRYPITTYLVSLAIAPYANYSEYYRYGDNDSMLLDYYVYPENLEDAKIAFSEMHDFLDGLSFYLGDYPFLEEKYGHAEFGWGGGMEHQTITSIGRVSSSVGWKYLYVHELGHQWFGDMVTCASWTEIWLNEGFASYTEALYAEWAGFLNYPPGEESYHAYMSYQKYLDGGTIFVSDTTDESNIFGRIVYDKGSWVLHMLRKIMGDEAFFTSLRKYLNDDRWSYGSVTTDNFRSICEEESGLFLTTFFNQWLYYPYYPRYEYFWKLTTNKELIVNNVDLTILQKQLSPVYEMPVDLTFQFEDGSDTSITVQNTAAEQTYEFNFDKTPVHLYFDKNDWILKSAAEIPGTDYTSEINIQRIYPNPSQNSVTIEVNNWDLNRTYLQIFDISGQHVQTIHPITKRLFTEYFQWDGLNQNGNQVSSGTYLVRPIMQNGNIKRMGNTKKIVLTR